MHWEREVLVRTCTTESVHSKFDEHGSDVPSLQVLRFSLVPLLRSILGRFTTDDSIAVEVNSISIVWTIVSCLLGMISRVMLVVLAEQLASDVLEVHTS